MRVTAKFRDYEHGATKGFVDFFINGSVVINGATLVQGKNGPFIGLPQIEVNGEYRDVISGVSKEFADKLLKATLEAREAEKKEASVGKGGDGYYDVHIGVLDNPKGAIRAMASVTVSEVIDSEKSAFTINSIRVNQGNHNMYLGMPSRRTNNEQYPYEKLCSFIGGSKKYIEGLVIGAAQEKLGIHRKAALADRVKDAAEKSAAKSLEDLENEQPVHANSSMAR